MTNARDKSTCKEIRFTFGSQHGEVPVHYRWALLLWAGESGL